MREGTSCISSKVLEQWDGLSGVNDSLQPTGWLRIWEQLGHLLPTPLEAEDLLLLWIAQFFAKCDCGVEGNEEGAQGKPGEESRPGSAQTGRDQR